MFEPHIVTISFWKVRQIHYFKLHLELKFSQTEAKVFIIIISLNSFMNLFTYLLHISNIPLLNVLFLFVSSFFFKQFVFSFNVFSSFVAIKLYGFSYRPYPPTCILVTFPVNLMTLNYFSKTGVPDDRVKVLFFT